MCMEHLLVTQIIRIGTIMKGWIFKMVYEKVSPELNFVDREKQVEKFWKENDIFEKSIENRKEGETYTFYDGPPTANGKPHIGHVLTRVIKDMIPRYRTMKGYMVPRKAGWDTHGLPVELEVEKKLGLDGKEQIEEYGLEPFIKHCKESVWKYKGMWEDFSSTVGFWADMDNPYVTYDNNFIESEWWALKQIWDKGLLYKGFKIVPYCPRCGTPLSSHEVAQGYKAVKERSAVVRFKVVGEDAYFLAWTTTPWTLPSNVALCVNPDETYVKVKAADGYTYYMAEALCDTVLGKLADEETDTKAYDVLETYKGKDLEYKEYEPLFDCAVDICEKQHKKGYFVTCADYVTLTDGTGVVHIAPAFGEDDAQVGRRYDLPFVQLVNGKGEMTKETPYEGVFVKKADPMVLKDLEEKGLLFDKNKILLDPYAKAVAGQRTWGIRWDHTYHARVVKDRFDWGDMPQSKKELCDLIIYELHVRDFTHHPSSGVQHRGTFSGLMEKIPYLKELGINAVELMPIFEFDETMNSRTVDGRQLLECWGYNTVGFFAPNSSYAAANEHNQEGTELKTLIKALHDNGIEVILDVVFNHTAEGNEKGNTFSFKGFDNNIYYMLTAITLSFSS